MIIYRHAELSDINGMIPLLFDLFQIEEDFNFDEKKQSRGLEILLKNEGSAIFVASLNNKIIGMVTVQILISTAEGGLVGIIEDLVVNKKYQKQKIGLNLLKEVYQWSHNKSIKRLQLLADKNNYDALNFYTKTKWESTSLICLRKYL